MFNQYEAHSADISESRIMNSFDVSGKQGAWDHATKISDPDFIRLDP
jgi:hypothetical protein